MTHLGLRVEFEVPGRRTVALQDDAGLTLFLAETTGEVLADGVVLTFQVDDVEAAHRALAARGVPFVRTPQLLFWGYGAELNDPDGHLIRLWDATSMREKGGHGGG